MRLNTVRVPPSSRSGNTKGLQYLIKNIKGSHLGRRPTLNGSRRPTRGEVHADNILQLNIQECIGNTTSSNPHHNLYIYNMSWRWISSFDLLGFSGLPLNGFTYSWTLSSKFFSTFPHGTCSLSVSWSYLALDGVYHPLRAALSSNPTLRRNPPEMRLGHYGPGTLYG